MDYLQKAVVYTNAYTSRSQISSSKKGGRLSSPKFFPRITFLHMWCSFVGLLYQFFAFFIQVFKLNIDFETKYEP